MPTFPQFVRFFLARPALFEAGQYPHELFDPEISDEPLTDELDRLVICLRSRSKFLAGDWPVDAEAVRAVFDAMAV